jgi:hypothetical protein
MTTPVEELKIRAKLLKNALAGGDAEALQKAQRIAKKQRWTTGEDWSLAVCLNLVAAQAGFQHWEHARAVLAGEAAPHSDMGSFWYELACAATFNHWYPNYAEARESLQHSPGRYLLPYGSQCVVAEAAYVIALGMDPASPHWAAINHDLVAGYGSTAWAALVQERLAFTRNAKAAAPRKDNSEQHPEWLRKHGRG